VAAALAVPPADDLAAVAAVLCLAEPVPVPVPPRPPPPRVLLPSAAVPLLSLPLLLALGLERGEAVGVEGCRSSLGSSVVTVRSRPGGVELVVAAPPASAVPLGAEPEPARKCLQTEPPPLTGLEPRRPADLGQQHVPSLPAHNQTTCQSHMQNVSAKAKAVGWWAQAATVSGVHAMQ
jgi:hypothetical protein